MTNGRPCQYHQIFEIDAEIFEAGSGAGADAQIFRQQAKRIG
jgi:hypothetical protein